MPQLAIIIPAYKAIYLSEALDSLVNQTNKEFEVYIGDDASPENLYQIIKEYEGKLNILYKRFEVNLGGKDLVAQWERCIDMATEDWLWLFSDDDVLEPKCVEVFYNFIENNKTAELLHFDVEMIDKNSAYYAHCEPFPEVMTTMEYFEKRINYQINSFVVEYVFTRDLYLRENKFQNFDLAWGADDATWLKFSKSTGIYTLPGAKVKWRFSDSNVSSVTKDIPIITRKINAMISYVKWVQAFFKSNNIAFNTSKTKIVRWILGSVDNARSFKLSTRMGIAKLALNGLGEEYS
jgi:glycosyltransferase involved in cell wall biosynthesis